LGPVVSLTIRAGAIAPLWKYLFRSGGTDSLNRTKSFTLCAPSVVKRMQNINAGSPGASVMSDDFAQTHSDPVCMFVSVSFDGSPNRLA